MRYPWTIVTITDDHAVFAFLGFEFRWVPSPKTGRWYPCTTPRPKKITLVLQKVRDTLRASRPLSVPAAVAQVNPILRGRRSVPTGIVIVAILGLLKARDIRDARVLDAMST